MVISGKRVSGHCGRRILAALTCSCRCFSEVVAGRGANYVFWYSDASRHFCDGVRPHKNIPNHTGFNIFFQYGPELLRVAVFGW